ncbi:hypothetical protein ACFL2S_09985 [Thermodesulfobacteriota bacterium]
MIDNPKVESTKYSHLSHAIFNGLTNLFEEISNDLSDRNKCKLFIKKVLAAYKDEDIDKLEKLVSKLPDKIRQIYPKSNEVINKLQLDLDRMISDRFNHIAEKLREYAKAKDIPIKGVSPNFVIDGLVEVILNKKNKSAKVGASGNRNLKWDSIRELLDNERKRIWKRPVIVRDYRDELLFVYESLMETKPNPSGWVALTDIYQNLKKNRERKDPNWRKGGRVASYYKDEFSADLSKLWQAQVRGEVPIPHIELSAIRNPKKSYIVVLHSNQTDHFGFLRPRRH